MKQESKVALIFKLARTTKTLEQIPDRRKEAEGCIFFFIIETEFAKLLLVIGQTQFL